MMGKERRRPVQLLYRGRVKGNYQDDGKITVLFTIQTTLYAT